MDVVYCQGLWVGQTIPPASSSETSPPAGEQLTWSLVLAGASPHPSAFGAVLRTDSKAKDLGISIVLYGDWSPTAKTLKVTEKFVLEDPLDERWKTEFRAPRKYNARLKKDVEGFIWLNGVYESTFLEFKDSTKDEKEVGQFIVRLEEQKSGKLLPDEKRFHISGLWMGEANPAEELKEFLFPINPIRWSLSMIFDKDVIEAVTSSSKAEAVVFGSGYFSDSADIKGSPILFFSLTGFVKSGKLEIQKIYEPSPQTLGIVVNYQASVELDLLKESTLRTLKGKWKNSSSGSFGDFTCEQETANSSSSAQIVICKLCRRLVNPGESRLMLDFLPGALEETSYCESCAFSTDSLKHPQRSDFRFRAVLELFPAKGSCSSEIMADSFKKFAHRPLFGRRKSPEVADFEWTTYHEVGEFSWNLALSLRTIKSSDSKAKLTVFICDIGEVLAVGMLATIINGGIIASLDPRSEPDDLSYVLETAGESLETVVIDSKHIPRFKEAITKFTSGKPVLVVENDLSYLKDTALLEDEKIEGSSPKKLSSLLRFEDSSKSERKVVTRPMSDIAAVLFTSGSSGRPKGVLFSEELMYPSEAGVAVRPFLRLDVSSFDPSFALSLVSSLHLAGSRVFTKDISTLFEDLQATRPSHFGAPPAVWNHFFTEYTRRVTEHSKASTVPDLALRMSLAEEQAASELRTILGGRLNAATSGGAWLSPQIAQFIRNRLQVDLADLYGSRETGGIARDGQVYPQVDVYIHPTEDSPVPEDFDKSVVVGEICVSSPRLVLGYWNDDKLNSEKFISKDGKKYYKTGDVGYLITKEGKRYIYVLGRAGWSFKTSKGEWINPATIETALESSPLITNALCIGGSKASGIAAVVVPSSAGLSETSGDEALMLRLLRLWCSQKKLKPSEIPRRVFIEKSLQWEKEGLLTSLGKKKRSRLLKHYNSVLEQFFKEEESKTSSSLEDSKEKPKADSERYSKLKEIVSKALGTSEWDVERTFYENGGDSFSVAQLLRMLSQLDILTSPSELSIHSLENLFTLWSSEDGFSRSAMGSMQSDESSSDFWRNEARLPEDVPFFTERDMKGKPSTGILVTGCPGFLGIFLLYESLLFAEKHLIPVVCILRAESDSAAKSRLLQAFEEAQLTISAKSMELLRVCRGDVSKPLLGLTSERYEFCIANVSDIIHAAAVVNMALPYTILRGSNVEGTLNVLNLAQTASAQLHFVSTIGAVPKYGIDEDWPDEIPSKMHLKDGYSQTKVISELLLKKAVDTRNAKVRVYRPSALCGSAEVSKGFTNVADFSSLVMRVAADVGLYVDKATLKVRWFPVDIAAKAIMALSLGDAKAETLGKVYHLIGFGPTYSMIFNAMKRSLPLEAIPEKDWKEKSSEIARNPKHPAVPLLDVISRMKFGLDFNSESDFRTQHTKDAMKKAGVPWIDVTEDLINSMVENLIKRGFLTKK